MSFITNTNISARAKYQPIVKIVYLSFASILLSMALVRPSLANNGGVHGPIVKANHQQIDYRLGFVEAKSSEQVNAWLHRLHFERSLNDKVKVRVVAEFIDQEHWRFDDAKLEVLYNFNKFDSGDDNYASGLRVDLRSRKGSAPEDISIHWTNQYNMNDTSFVRGILIMGQNISSGVSHSIGLGTRFSYYQKLGNGIDVGIETFNGYGKVSKNADFEQQTHQIGPAMLAKLGNVSLYARYLRGLTENTSDHAFSLRLAYNF